MNPRVYVILRNDDPSAVCNPAHERRILELFERYQIPQGVAVIPHVVDDPHDDRMTTYHPLHENPAMVALLREYHAKGLIEIAQHGFTHQTNRFRPTLFYAPPYPDGVVPFPGHVKPWLPYAPAHPDGYSEFNGLPLADQRDKIIQGKRYLEGLFRTELQTFVFPWNSLSQPSLEILREVGFRFVPCEEGEHIAEGLHLIGCCFWGIEAWLEQIAAALACGKPTLLQLSYHSWILTEPKIQELEEALRFIAYEPQVTCITPRQLPMAVPGLPDILRRRARTVQLATQVNRHLQVPHRDSRTYYVMNSSYYRQRMAKLRAALFLLRDLGINRVLWLSGVVGAAALWSAIHRYAVEGRVGLGEAAVLLSAGILGAGAGLLMWREWRLGATVRGPLQKCLDVAASWRGFVTLWAWCSPLESLRERAARRFGPHRRTIVEPGSRPSVCVIEESWGWGGAEVHTWSLIEHLIARGYRVEYLSGRTNAMAERARTCGDRMKAFDPADVSVIQSPLCVYDDQDTKQQWLRQFERLHSRVLLFPALDVQFGSAPFLRACRRVFERIVYIEHTLPPPLPPLTRKRYVGGRLPGLGLWWHKERLRRRFRSRCAHRVVAVSDAVREQFITQWSCPAEKIVTIHNGIDWRAFQATEAMRAEARQRHRIPQGAIVFGMLARLNSEKGVDLAIEAFRGLQEAEPAKPAYLVIAGDGPEGPALQALAATYGLSDRIRFLGFVAQPMSVLPLFDAMLLPSRFEGLPLALLEGMAAGAVPIVARVGGMPEVVNDPEIGWVVEPEDVAGFAQAMAQAVALEPSAIAHRRRQMLKRVQEAFDAGTNYDALMSAAGLQHGHPYAILPAAAWRRSGWRTYRGAVESWLEFASLLARCSPIEWVRERTVRRLRTNLRKPPLNSHPSVCIIAENDGWGGTEVHTLMLIERLLSLGYRVEYLSARTNELDARLARFDPNQVHVIQSPLSIFDQSRAARERWQQQLERLHSRTLLLPVPLSHFGSFAFLRACRRTFERIVYIQHTLPDPMPALVRKRHLGGRIAGLGMAWYKERLRRAYRMRCAHRSIAVSDEVREQYITHWACAPEKVLTIRNGIDWRKFQVAEPDRAKARRTYNLPSDALVFGMLTRLSEEKGVDLAIEGFRRLLATKPARPTYLVIAGEGPDAQAIKASAAGKDLAGRVVFAGFVNRPLEVLSLMDVIVFSSRAEGLPLALLEGMAAGAIPLIARVGGMPEVVNSPEVGWVVEPGDAGALSQAMAQVLTLDAAAIASRRRHALQRVQEGFDAHASYDAILKAAELKS